MASSSTASLLSLTIAILILPCYRHGLLMWKACLDQLLLVFILVFANFMSCWTAFMMPAYGLDLLDELSFETRRSFWT